MAVRHKSPELGAIELSKDASLVVVDRGYLRKQKKWRSYVAQTIDCPLVQVESDVVVPVEVASPKEEYSAATFRPKIKKKLDSYLLPLKEKRPKLDSLQLDFDSFDIEDPEKAVSSLEVNRSVRKVEDFHGGATEAKKRLEDFLKSKLDHYEKLRNDPTKEFLSNMSPFLHFGQISPIYIALKVLETNSPGKGAYLEELVVRRELSLNFVFYNHNYDSFGGLPKWAKKTLNEHQKDPRRHIYTLEELENSKTHDPYWNAAQKEMRIRGKMHGYMRMYWGKKIIEWTRTPEEAFKTALYLNNKYELDGRDPNGF
ncbi:MAG: deoxyribodipyrimidine photolyase, partial [Candidatus Bathyarchaeota archaeon]|nr:deoxyribodipyrimidine photolyase [Candidatus Bathyarchaeota archaeon]